MGTTFIATRETEWIPCPLCDTSKFSPWATENGYDCVRCSSCGLLYVNPRPAKAAIDRGVQLGMHEIEQSSMNVVGSRARWKVRRFAAVIRRMFPDLLSEGEPIRWLDIGAGFGEMIEAAALVTPPGSVCEGIEPMVAKADAARRRSLPVRSVYLSEVRDRFDVVSIIDVFSHIPDFKQFLNDLKQVLEPGGQVLMKTGNAADVGSRDHIPGPLTLPDHLVFAGVEQLRQYLESSGFDMVSCHPQRVDGVWYTIRNILKRLVGKPVRIGLPYMSPLRTLYIRARLRGR